MNYVLYILIPLDGALCSEKGSKHVPTQTANGSRSIILSITCWQRSCSWMGFPPSACLPPRCGAGPCLPIPSAGHPATRTCRVAPPAHSAGCPSRNSPGSASPPWARCSPGRHNQKWLMPINISLVQVTGLMVPVLNVLPHNKEVGLDEPLDHLTITLLTGRQFSGNRDGLCKRNNGH